MPPQPVVPLLVVPMRGNVLGQQKRSTGGCGTKNPQCGRRNGTRRGTAQEGNIPKRGQPKKKETGRRLAARNFVRIPPSGASGKLENPKFAKWPNSRKWPIPRNGSAENFANSAFNNPTEPLPCGSCRFPWMAVHQQQKFGLFATPKFGLCRYAWSGRENTNSRFSHLAKEITCNSHPLGCLAYFSLQQSPR
jgi:hypothetical protein